MVQREFPVGVPAEIPAGIITFIFYSPDLINGFGRFIVDTGATTNVIRATSLLNPATNTVNFYYPNANFIGTTTLSVEGVSSEFIVVHEVPFGCDGILDFP